MSASEALGTADAALARGRALLVEAPALAERQADEILRILPDWPDAVVLRAAAMAAAGRGVEARDTLRAAAGRRPDASAIWHALADHDLVAGDEGAADAARAQAIRAAVNDPRLREAAMALCDGELAVAERLLKPHLKSHPTDVAAIRMLAELAARIGRHGDAETLLRRAIELASGFAPARFNLALLMFRQGRHHDALGELERLRVAQPDDPGIGSLTAAVLARLGDYDEALDRYAALLDRQPGLVKAWLGYGHALKTVGRQADSVAAYRRCIALAPQFGEAWWSLANLKTVRLSEDDVASMTKALEGDGMSRDDRLHIRFALGKAHEDLGRPDAAFGHYREGNRLRLEATPYDADATHRQVDRTIAVVAALPKAGRGCPAPDPIFVLGMPRAGSTLVEQILASHPLVEGTEELPDIQMLAGGLGGDDDRYPDILATLDAARCRAIGERYVERTRPYRRSGRPFFVDKMPNNWLHVPLIHLALPNARIVDARRHPLACCVSNFRQHYARGQAFAYDLADIGRYYADYVALMDAIDRDLPGRVHRVFYEAMVEDTEGETRRLLDHLGLPFDPACLRFHETERAVRTASSEQVRKPIFRDGLAPWRPFDRWLQPLRDALGPALAAYPYQPAAA